MNYRNKQPDTALIKSLILSFMVALSLIGYSQKATPDSTRFAIGSQVNITLELPYSVGQQVTWPVIGDTITKSIEVLAKSKIDTLQSEGSNKKILRQIIGVTSFDTGFIALPPFNFEVKGADGQRQILATEPVLFEVIKTQVDLAADIKDIKPIIEAPITFRELLPWILGLLLLAAIIYLAYRYLKNRKKQPVTKEAPKVRISSWETALTKLEQLKASQLWQKGDVKEYYTRLTDILREYFEARYQVTAAEMTSSEILDALIPHVRNEELITKLRNMLFWSDMAKFAKAQPGTFENEESIKYSVEIVKGTRPDITENNQSVS